MELVARCMCMNWYSSKINIVQDDIPQRNSCVYLQKTQYAFICRKPVKIGESSNILLCTTQRAHRYVCQLPPNTCGTAEDAPIDLKPFEIFTLNISIFRKNC